MGIKIGWVGYTNKSSGIGIFGWELLKNLNIDSILSVNAGVKGQEKWIDRQIMAKRPPSVQEIKKYFSNFRPDIVIFMETPFAIELYDIAKEHNCKTVAIPMHETYTIGKLKPDLAICPCYSAYKKVSGRKKLLFLPISADLFPFKLRTGHDFVCNIGYGGPHDRRQSLRVVQAFRQLDSNKARLIINAQSELAENIMNEANKDKRIKVNIGQKTCPKDIYADGDISIAVMAYGGYERLILESMLSGMPTLTVNADPMNLFQHDKNFLIEPQNRYFIKSSEWIVNTIYNQVGVNDLAEKMKWLLKLETAKYSERARCQALAQSWEGPIDYKSIWLETLEELCSEQFI